MNTTPKTLQDKANLDTAHSNNILKTLALSDKVEVTTKTTIATVPGLAKYTKENIKLLLTTYELADVKAYIRIEKKYKKKTYKVKDSIYIRDTGIGLGISTEPTASAFKVTGHTLFTLLQELNVKPSKVKVVKDINEIH